jgi:hypothetical protein
MVLKAGAVASESDAAAAEDQAPAGPSK